MRRTPRYQWLEHTADIKIRVFGQCESDLYESAALAMTELIAENLDGTELERTITIQQESPRLRLLELLRELVYRFDVEGLLTVGAAAELHGDVLILDTRAVVFDPHRHVGLREIKAVTYHQLDVRQSESTWFADLVFDV